MRPLLQNGKTTVRQLSRRTTPRSPQTQRRHQSSSSTPEPVPEKSKSTSPTNSPQSSNPSSSPSPSAGKASTATPPSSVCSGSRSLAQIIQEGPIGKAGRSYSNFQERRPYATQIASSVVIYLCGDLSAQLLFPENAAQASRESTKSEAALSGKEHGDRDDKAASSGGGYDPWRTLRHLTIGVGSSIPSYKWFMFLHHNFNFQSKFRSILTKVCVQQIVFTPVFNSYFFGMHSLLSGASLQETWERLKLALPVSITNSVKLWPAVTAFSFMYVSPQFRSVFSGVIAVGWQTYLSWLNQKAAQKVAAEIAESPELVSGNISSSAVTLNA